LRKKRDYPGSVEIDGPGFFVLKFPGHKLFLPVLKQDIKKREGK